MKKYKKLAITGIIAIVVISGFAVSQLIATEQVPVLSHTVLVPGNLSDTINIRGTVESTQSRNVFSSLNFIIEETFVEVGDFVHEGDILAILDTADLQLNIAQSRAELNIAQENAQTNIDNSTRIYNEARTNLNTGLDPQVLNAQSSLRSAEINLDIAASNLADIKADYENPSNAQLAAALSSFTSAQLDLENVQRTHENNSVLFAAGAIPRNTYENSETALTNAQNRFADAKISLTNAETNLSRNLESATSQYTNARISYENAVLALQTAINTANQNLTGLLANIDASVISANNEARLIAIERLEMQLADSIIRAPISGTVTADFATIGSSAQGLLFVIEDIDNLKITTQIREYDAANVQVGMPVEIRSDSTGASVFNGQISGVDPTALRNALGEIANTNDVEFAAQVIILDTDTQLRIGMNTRLNVILQEVSNVLFVPFDAIGFDIDGQAFVYIAQGSGGNHIAQRANVSLGLETDFFIEIYGDNIFAGQTVLNNASILEDGMAVNIVN